MKTRAFKRFVAVLICGLLLCVSVPAQLTFGPHGMRSVAAPTLRNRTRLSRGIAVGRPRLSFVRAIGGVAFDGTAKPEAGLKIANMTLAYSPTASDGERLVVTINDQPVAATIYDWQLVPIAKFVASDSFSCFTLFGSLKKNAQLQRKVLRQGGRIMNYHPAFVNTLMGLRLFQLDSLIISPYSWDLVKDGQNYLVGAGEPGFLPFENKRGLALYQLFARTLPPTAAYVISDNRRNIVFKVEENKLSISGEPSYYFWDFDRFAFTPEKLEKSKTVVRQQLREEASKADERGELTQEDWVITRVLAAAKSFEQQVGDLRVVVGVGDLSLLEFFLTTDAARRVMLESMSLEKLVDRLIVVRALNRLQYAVEIPEASEKVSNQTQMLRAINPIVWDAGVNLLRYAAFFRYYKKNYPRQWQDFMRQIRQAPRPQPYVTTPTILEGQ